MHRDKEKIGIINSLHCYIDIKNSENIKNFLQDKGWKKVSGILSYIADGSATKNVYSTENYASNIKDVSAIKLKAKQFTNARIYCKDYKNSKGQRVIILCELLKSKKQDKLTKKEKTLIDKVNNYDYKT